MRLMERITNDTRKKAERSTNNQSKNANSVRNKTFIKAALGGLAAMLFTVALKAMVSGGTRKQDGAKKNNEALRGYTNEMFSTG